MIKNPPANAGDMSDAVLSLGQEDPLEEEMATPSNVFAWKIPWAEGAWRAIQSMGLQRVRSS